MVNPEATTTQKKVIATSPIKAFLNVVFFFNFDFSNLFLPFFLIFCFISPSIFSHFLFSSYIFYFFPFLFHFFSLTYLLSPAISYSPHCLNKFFISKLFKLCSYFSNVFFYNTTISIRIVSPYSFIYSLPIKNLICIGH